MSDDDFISEVTHESWFGRIGGAIKGILFGLVFLLIAFVLLFWNEGRAVKRAKTLEEGAGVVVSVSPDKVDPANEGKLIHISGLATTDETLTDNEFGISANGIKLRRKAEMYQWKETSSSKTEKKVGGGTKTTKTYSYHKVWSDQLINSSSFKKSSGHENPSTMRYTSKEITAQKVTIGEFVLSPSLIGSIENYESLPVEGLPSGQSMESPNVMKVVQGSYYIGRDPASPEIGDTKISFQVIKPATVSLIAKQTGNTFEPYQTKAGGNVELLTVGASSADAMFDSAQKANTLLTWILRVVGFIAMFMGLSLILKPLSVALDVLPLLGNIAEMGIGLVAFLVATGLSLIIISIAWLFYRPLIAIILIAIAVAFIVGVRMLPKRETRTA